MYLSRPGWIMAVAGFCFLHDRFHPLPTLSRKAMQCPAVIVGLAILLLPASIEEASKERTQEITRKRYTLILSFYLHLPSPSKRR